MEHPSSGKVNASHHQLGAIAQYRARKRAAAIRSGATPSRSRRCLEVELQRKLDRAWPIGRRQDCARPAGNVNQTVVAEEWQPRLIAGLRALECGVIPNVEELRPEFHRLPFSHARHLDQREVPVLLEGTAEDIAAEQAYGATACAFRIGDRLSGHWVSPQGAGDNRILVVDADAAEPEGVEIDVTVEPILDASRSQDLRARDRQRLVIRVHVVRVLQRWRAAVKDQEWRTRLEGGDAVKRPAIDELAPSAVLNTGPTGKGQFPVVADHQPVRPVKVRQAAAGA